MQQLTVTLDNHAPITVDFGTRIETILERAGISPRDKGCIGVLVNNELRGLTCRIQTNAQISLITLEKSQGLMMYRRSLSFLLSMAAQSIFPDRRLVISHSLGDGYYYTFDDGLPVEEKEIHALESEMKRLVEEDLPIRKRIASYQEAVDHFREKGQHDTTLLLEHRNEGQIELYTCNEFLDLAHVPLAPRTGMLIYFEVMPYGSGFLLRYPSSRDPYRLQPFRDNPTLFAIYQEYKDWGKILQVHSVGKLNGRSSSGEIKHFIRVAEALHDKKIAEIADRIHDGRDHVRAVLIAGPSSSGKTTFTKKLAIQLQVLGFNPEVISLDDYYHPHHKVPLDEKGDYDFESLEAIDVPLLNDHLLQLFDGKGIEIPRFDFKSGQRKPQGKPLKLTERSILLMEGIHGLNEDLTPRIPRDMKYKVYLSALTQLNLDDHNRISTTDNRLVRRMVRDAKFRGSSAIKTLSMWPSVRRGENRNIFPFQDSADSAFNSALDYELSVLKLFAEPLLREVKPSDVFYHEAVRLLSFLNNFVPIPSYEVPDHSILREFIGKSGFKY